jgi:hypothetical protein
MQHSSKKVRVTILISDKLIFRTATTKCHGQRELLHNNKGLDPSG